VYREYFTVLQFSLFLFEEPPSSLCYFCFDLFASPDSLQAMLHSIKGGQYENKVRKSQICKIADFNNLLDLRTFQKCGNLPICHWRTQPFCDLQIL
jgi:hypothetical protein